MDVSQVHGHATHECSLAVAQFVTPKTVSLRKSIVGLTFIRESDIKHPFFTQNAARQGAD